MQGLLSNELLSNSSLFGNKNSKFVLVAGNSLISTVANLFASSKNYVCLQTWQMAASGTIRVSFNLSFSGSSDWNTYAYAQVYINSNPTYYERKVANGNTIYSQDITVKENDLVQIYGKIDTGGGCTGSLISNASIGITGSAYFK